MTRKTHRNFLAIFAFLLFSANSYGAAFQFGGIRHDLTKITSAAGTTVLTKASFQVENVTGTTTQTIQLPSSATLAKGYWFTITNDSTGTVTLNDGSGALLGSLTSGQALTAYLSTVSGTAGTWTLVKGAGSGGVGGGSAMAVLTKTAAYTVVAPTDFTGARLMVEMNATSAVTLTLPAASNSGYEINVINIGSATVTISTAGSDTFGSTTDTTWTLIPGGSPQSSNKFISNGGSRWAGF
jgi:hypothetical protein